MDISSRLVLLENPSSNEYSLEIGKMSAISENWLFNNTNIDLWKKHCDYHGYFFVDKQTNKPVAGISITRNPVASAENDLLYYIEFFYCHPEWRKHGLGSILFNKCMEHAKGHPVALHGVAQMEQFYEKKHGFDKYEDHRYFAIIIPYHDLKYPEIEATDDFTIKNVSEVHEEDIRIYDKSICQLDRGDYFLGWLNTSHSKVAVNNDGKVVGIVALRLNLGGTISVAPLYANSQKIALHLLVTALKDCPYFEENTRVYIKFAEVHDAVVGLASQISKTPVVPFRRTLLQYTREIIKVPEEKIFSVMMFSHTIV